ncbi:MAG: amidohydrolase family protein [Bryobacteraceae bacterium]
MRTILVKMVRSALAVICALAFTACQSTPQRPLEAIVGATLIDGNGGPAIADSIVVIEGSRIRAAGPRSDVPIPAAAEKIDGRGRWIVPGLIDLHVHLGAKAAPEFVAADYTRERIERNLNAYLRFGVTTVRSVGTDREAGFEVRKAQRAGARIGARLFTAGRGFTCTGGHPSQEIGAIARQVDTPEEARKQVAELDAQQADLIKIWVDSLGGKAPKIKGDVRAAIVSEAQRFRIPVVAHIQSLADTQQLLKAGASGFLHMVRDTEEIPQAFLDELKAKQIVFTPTLVRQELAWLYREHPELLDAADVVPSLEPGVLEAVRAAAAKREASPAARKEFDIAVRNTRKFALAGISIAVGSDGGSSIDFPGAMTHRELEILVGGGFTAGEAIMAATRNGALALGKTADFGTIEKGKLADLVIVTADPLADVRNLRKIERVMYEGEWTAR